MGLGDGEIEGGDEQRARFGVPAGGEAAYDALAAAVWEAFAA